MEKKRPPDIRKSQKCCDKPFSLRPNGVNELKSDLREIFRFRDLTVHPPGNVRAPVLHPELQVEVEWRFVAFCAENATAIVNKVQSIVQELTNKGKPSNPEIQRYIEGLRSLMASDFP